MNAHPKILVFELLVLMLTPAVTGPEPGTETDRPLPARTVEIHIGSPVLGCSWSGSVWVDESGGMRLSADPGLRLEDEEGLLHKARQAVRLLRALVQRPPRLVLPRLTGPAN